MVIWHPVKLRNHEVICFEPSQLRFHFKKEHRWIRDNGAKDIQKSHPRDSEILRLNSDFK